MGERYKEASDRSADAVAAGPRSTQGERAVHENNLRYLRDKVGLSQAQVAAQLGVSSKTYSSWETGRTELGAERIRALCDLLGCTPSDVLGYRGHTSFAPVTTIEETIVDLYGRLAPNVRMAVLEIMRDSAKKRRPR